VGVRYTVPKRFAFNKENAMYPRIGTLFTLFLTATVAWADGPQDNFPDKVAPIPPPGIKIEDKDRAELSDGVDALGKDIDALRGELKMKPKLLALLPDVQIFHNAVRYALKFDEFYKPAEVAVARIMLKVGGERAKALREGKAPWTTATGLVVRGYISRIDGSVQPYGLVVPESYQPNTAHKFRLDFWCHGRGVNLTELSFLDGRMKSPGEFTPTNAFVVHLYGRYCCANKLAGEVDLFEAYENIKQNYPIDENRLVIRGFSMGGAACWQFAVHYPSMFAAAAPGAGFSETPDFLKVFQKETLKPTEYEKKLWHLYDCTDYAVNLYNLPTVAYSGEIDTQKQAADIMARALEAEGMTLTHIIGPKTGHSYHPVAKAEVNRRIDSIVSRGRNPMPPVVRFTTWSLRYNRSYWVSIEGMQEHWERSRVDAQISGKSLVTVETKGVTALTLDMPSGYCPLDTTTKPKIVIDKQELSGPGVETDKSWKVHLQKKGDKWAVVASHDSEGLRKHHGLQGPIDDAFLDRFIMVKPTGKPMNDKTGAWVTHEMGHAIDHWRKQYRGEAMLKNDDAISDADIASSNLILWGDPSSNKVLAKIADKLPIGWNSQGIKVGAKEVSSGDHVVLMIYPNPLNPKRYVVLNSGFTFREYDYLNNARQVPKLPDYAIVDVKTPVNSRWPGGVVTADFFDESWKLPTK